MKLSEGASRILAEGLLTQAQGLFWQSQPYPPQYVQQAGYPPEQPVVKVITTKEKLEKLSEVLSKSDALSEACRFVLEASK